MVGVCLIVTSHESRPNIWGTHPCASRAAAALYSEDSAELARTAEVFKGYLNDRSSDTEFDYRDLSWLADPDHPGGINSKRVTRKDGKE